MCICMYVNVHVYACVCAYTYVHIVCVYMNAQVFSTQCFLLNSHSYFMDPPLVLNKRNNCQGECSVCLGVVGGEGCPLDLPISRESNTKYHTI